MKISDLQKALSAKKITKGGVDKEITKGYCGDLLSVALEKIKDDGVWFTIMKNANVAAVSLLTKVGVVVLCGGVQPDDALIKRMDETNQTLLSTELNVFEAVKVAVNHGL